MAFDFIAQQLSQQKEQARYRQRFCLTNLAGQNIQVDGTKVANGRLS